MEPSMTSYSQAKIVSSITAGQILGNNCPNRQSSRGIKIKEPQRRCEEVDEQGKLDWQCNTWLY